MQYIKYLSSTLIHLYSKARAGESNLLSLLFTIQNGRMVQLKIPSDLDPESARRLSLNLGGGACHSFISWRESLRVETSVRLVDETD